MRRYLASTNNLQDLQLYVMLLVGIKLLLRESELADLKIDSSDNSINRIKWDASTFSGSGDLRGLAFEIKGKGEKKGAVKMMFRSFVR